jgi:hypothetical protein
MTIGAGDVSDYPDFVGERTAQFGVEGRADDGAPGGDFGTDSDNGPTRWWRRRPQLLPGAIPPFIVAAMNKPHGFGLSKVGT